MSAIAKNIVKLRKGFKYTQDEFAARIGIKRSALGAYEEARAKPPYEIVFKICRMFSITDVECFVMGEDWKLNHIHFKEEKGYVALKYEKSQPNIKKAINVLLEIE